MGAFEAIALATDSATFTDFGRFGSIVDGGRDTDIGVLGTISGRSFVETPEILSGRSGRPMDVGGAGGGRSIFNLDADGGTGSID